MKVLILGGTGQLGTCLQAVLSQAGIAFEAPSRRELNLETELEFTTLVAAVKPSIVVNAAAYTAVDKAEHEPELAYMLNATMPEKLAIACQQADLPLIHISTDYVFNGKTNKPYFESDLTEPVSVYGKSKLAGELAVLEHCEQAIIIRTSWLYSEYGNNFLKTMIRLSKERSQLNVVADQIGTPTYAGDLALAILKIIQHSQHAKLHKDIYHFANLGVASWYDFAWHIFKQTASKIELNAITTEQYPTPATRPAYSILNSQKISNHYGVVNRHWLDALTAMMPDLP
ncbi:dTDP-4-dehydrorhamnose reductase [Rheinheimera sp. MMS21-TC3]|uniref:dTDP-4-dehydrorhamnose reductase n=1 Tax=Rheinheimera sp. MMS21-TC3 TaxID=3072790 RepID=UPI0028C463BB|nr:dTDP-4-dehydrorhamnose reductase [Rheinheimera sp. MMS21-TC3]WNO61678.1 dTDP-4-dehydrorhamnose reductase [Rheinheimera sp. MMS21-TC3]